jgi:glycerate kinase
MVEIVAAPNALKGSLSPTAAAKAIAAGIRRAAPEVEVRELPIADGGDGTAEVVGRALGAEFRTAPARDPLGRVRQVRYAWLADATALIDVAAASGIALLDAGERNPMTATSAGTGDLIRHALKAGARRVVLGAGGSATVDGAAGILQALGARLLDADHAALPMGGGALTRLGSLDLTELEPLALEVPIVIASDVDCVALGADGAAYTFGPQKGAAPSDLAELESGLSRWFERVHPDGLKLATSTRGGGAAGAIALGLQLVLGARIVSGVDWVLDTLGFDSAIAGAQLCITAEGQLDRQSLRNKGPVGVARRARAQGVPTVVLAGRVAPDVEAEAFAEFCGVFSICDGPITLERAQLEAYQLLERCAERVVRFAQSSVAQRWV